MMDKAATELRTMLMRDFGLNLKIGGGFGGSAEDPIVVMTADRLEAAATEMLVLRGIGRGRGALWRTLGRFPFERGGRWLEQVKIERIEATPGGITRGRANYYFDFSAADPGHDGLPAAPGFIDPKTCLSLPYEVGWLHLDEVTNNEPVVPSLGYSLAYGAPGMKATVFVYDRGIAGIPEQVEAEIPKAEFACAVSDGWLL